MLAAIAVCAAVTFALRFIPVQLAHRYRDREDLQELSAAVSVLVNLASRNFLIGFIAGFAAYSLSGLVLT